MWVQDTVDVMNQMHEDFMNKLRRVFVGRKLDSSLNGVMIDDTLFIGFVGYRMFKLYRIEQLGYVELVSLQDDESIIIETAKQFTEISVRKILRGN